MDNNPDFIVDSDAEREDRGKLTRARNTITQCHHRRTADAIRKLLWVIGTKNSNRISFKIIEPENSGFDGKKHNESVEQSATADVTDDPTNTLAEPIATSPDESSEI